jgi:thymidylate synthase
MMRSVHRNISFATIEGLAEIISTGEAIEVRGSRVQELRNKVTVLQRPLERCLFLPHRGNDIAATIAETVWVLAGRDDIGWLSTFLPRASEFSDDGVRWRGAYGPRLRDWHGVDQIAQNLRVLREEQSTRRAVISLFDADRDFAPSKDIPCNNWLHWLIRDNRLHLNIAIRSNDIIWGFSGINSFEWSVLQEMMAHWLGMNVGDATYLASSFHLYDRHRNRARKMIDSFNGVNCYDLGLSAPPFCTDFEDMQDAFEAFFVLEGQARQDPDKHIDDQRNLADPFLSVCLAILRIHHGMKAGWSTSRLSQEMASLPCCDLTAAAYEFYMREHPSLLESVQHAHLREFLEQYFGRSSETKRSLDLPRIAAAIKSLHARKNAAYGTAWKKRGEVMGILGNVARKVDRIEQYMTTGAEMGDESISDTAADLFVYLLKYQLFLMEQAPANAILAQLVGREQAALSDDRSALEILVDDYQGGHIVPRSARIVATDIVVNFEQLFSMVLEKKSSIVQRLDAARSTSDLAFELVCAFVNEGRAYELYFLNS